MGPRMWYSKHKSLLNFHRAFPDPWPYDKSTSMDHRTHLLQPLISAQWRGAIFHHRRTQVSESVRMCTYASTAGNLCTHPQGWPDLARRMMSRTMACSSKKVASKEDVPSWRQRPKKTAPSINKA